MHTKMNHATHAQPMMPIFIYVTHIQHGTAAITEQPFSQLPSKWLDTVMKLLAV